MKFGYKPRISPALKSCKRSHNGCCVLCWSCSWLSGAAGCFAGEALRSSAGSAAGRWVWDICVMHTHLSCCARTVLVSSVASSERSMQESMYFCAKICFAVQGGTSAKPKGWECAQWNWKSHQVPQSLDEFAWGFKITGLFISLGTFTLSFCAILLWAGIPQGLSSGLCFSWAQKAGKCEMY